MPIILHIVGWDEKHEDDDEQNDRDTLIRLRLLHFSAIVSKGIVC